MIWATSSSSQARGTFARRSFLGTAIGASAIAPSVRWALQLGTPGGGSLTKEQRDRLSPAQVVEELKKGNARFRAGKMVPRDYIAEKRASAVGQYPAAVILGCVDSRVPAEIIFDAGCSPFTWTKGPEQLQHIIETTKEYQATHPRKPRRRRARRKKGDSIKN